MKTIGVCGALALTFAAGGTALAQEAPASADSGWTADDIIVTARRREERLQDVPISVTALTGEALDERGVSSIEDLENFTPSMVMENVQGKATTPNVAIRGIRTAAAILSQDQPVALYFADAIFTPQQGAGTSFYDLASIQVLKGPQGTLFGRNTPGGAVLVAPARPESDFGALYSIAYGNYDYVRAQAMVNVPVSDKLELRAAVSYRDRDGFFRVKSGPQKGRDLGNVHSYGGRLSAIFRPTDGIENYTVAYWDRDTSHGPALALRELNPIGTAIRYNGTGAFAIYPDISKELQRGKDFPDGVYSELPTFDRNKAYGGVNTTTIELGDLTIKNILSYRKVKNEGLSDFDGTSALLLASHNVLNSRVVTEELQVQGRLFDGDVDWVVGAYGFWQDGFEYASVASLNPISTTNAVAFITDVDQNSYAAYGQFTAKLPIEHLSLTAGFRFTRDERELVATSRRVSEYVKYGVLNSLPEGCALIGAGGTPLPNDACRVAVKKSFSSPTWTVSLDYQPTDRTLLYLAHRAGYRSGGFNARGLSPSQFLPFSPEKVYDVEAGIKQQFRSGGMSGSINAAAFHTWYNDLQKTLALVVNGQPINSVFNAAQAKILGFEVEGTLRPTANLELTAGYSYVRPEYTEFDFLVGGVARDFSDRKFAYLPRHQLNVFGRYTFDLPPSAGELSFSASYQYMGGYVRSELYQNKDQLALIYTPAQLAQIPDDPAGFREPGRSLVDVRLDWEKLLGSRVDASLFVKNVFDTYYGGYGDSRFETLGFTSIVPGDPRTYGLEITIRM